MSEPSVEGLSDDPGLSEECPHGSSSGGYGPGRTWYCDECGALTGYEGQR